MAGDREALREYAERRHSPAASRELFGAIYRKIWDDEDVDLINFYHPLYEAQRGVPAQEASDGASH